MGEEAWAKDAHIGQSFRTSFCAGQPVVVGNVHARLQQPWTPEAFSALHGESKVRLIEVASGEQSPFGGYTLGQFFAGFGDVDKRPLPPRLAAVMRQAALAQKQAEDAAIAAAAGAATTRTAKALIASPPPPPPLPPPPLLKLRDWPSDVGFKELLPLHFDDLMTALPLG